MLGCGLAACAQGTTFDSGGAASGGGDAAGSGGASGYGGASGASAAGPHGGVSGAAGTASASGGAAGNGAGVVASACAPGEFATGVDLDGKLVCVPLSPLARDAINKGCSLYLGWRDKCSECTLDPSKWGRTSPASCMNGVGANDTCIAPMLDGVVVNLFGLNFDGDVNDDDKLHLGLDCPAVAGAAVAGPCEMGSLATGLSADGSTTCAPAAASIIEDVRARCSLYFGWRDECDNCTSAPSRWGRVSPLDCEVGTGSSGTCTKPLLGGKAVQVFGLATGGDVNGDDKLYFGVHCEAPAEQAMMAKDACPPGQLITAVAADGTLSCASPSKVVAEYFDASCAFYFGWRDSCDGCINPPEKWGRVRNGFCTNDVGTDDTCAPTVLNGTTVTMFGLNTDGDVGDDDKIYAGFRCE